MPRPDQRGEGGVEKTANAISSPLASHLPARVVAQRLGLSVRTIRRWVEEGRNNFPSAIQLPDSGLVFLEDDIKQWLARQRVVNSKKAEGPDAQES